MRKLKAYVKDQIAYISSSTAALAKDHWHKGVAKYTHTRGSKVSLHGIKKKGCSYPKPRKSTPT